jgi:D-xylose transport system substrate-binding protein
VANSDVAYYVSIDPFKVGKQQGQALLAALKDNGVASPAVAMINGSPTDSNAAPYRKGAHSVLDKAGVKVVYQPITKIANSAAELAVPLAQGKQPPAIAKAKVNNGMEDVPSVLLDTIAINKDNIDVLIKDGFVTPSQLCTGKYAKACADAGIK